MVTIIGREEGERDERCRSPWLHTLAGCCSGREPRTDSGRLCAGKRRRGGGYCSSSQPENSHCRATLHLYRLREEQFGGPTSGSRRLAANERIVDLGDAQPGKLRLPQGQRQRPRHRPMRFCVVRSGSTAEVELAVTPTAPGDITNTATATAEISPATPANSSSATVGVKPAPVAGA